MTATRKIWTYKDVLVHPAGINSAGIRWWAIVINGQNLRAQTKEGMRQLITHTL